MPQQLRQVPVQRLGEAEEIQAAEAGQRRLQQVRRAAQDSEGELHQPFNLFLSRAQPALTAQQLQRTGGPRSRSGLGRRKSSSSPPSAIRLACCACCGLRRI